VPALCAGSFKYDSLRLRPEPQLSGLRVVQPSTDFAVFRTAHIAVDASLWRIVTGARQRSSKLQCPLRLRPCMLCRACRQASMPAALPAHIRQT